MKPFSASGMAASSAQKAAHKPAVQFEFRRNAVTLWSRRFLFAPWVKTDLQMSS